MLEDGDITVGRKFRNTVTTGIVKEKQKNGDTYVYECEYRYDQETQKTVRISRHLRGKILAGQTEEIPTRQKKKKDAGKSENNLFALPLKGKRTRANLTDILEWGLETSGIKEDLYHCMSEGDAKKTLSLAEFFTAERSGTTPQIETWQLSHPIYYKEGLSEDICYLLYADLGENESARQSFFKLRANRLGVHPLIAFDITTISTYSENQTEARQGHNKAADGLDTIKYLLLYSVMKMEPIAYAKIPGNIADMSAVVNTIKELLVLGILPELVMDDGFEKEENYVRMLFAGIDFITPIKTNRKWVQKAIDDCRDGIQSIECFDDRTSGTYVKTIRVKHDFKYERKRASKEKNLQRGDCDTLTRTVNLHVCFDPTKKEQQDSRFFEKLQSIRKDLENGINPEDFGKGALELVKEYMITENDSQGNLLVKGWNIAACQKACKDHGFFVLLANKERNGFEALRKYRKREKIEEFFERDKQEDDGARPRVWYPNHLMGKMLVMFVALCLEDFLRAKFKKVKEFLEKELKVDPPIVPAETLALDKKLLGWLRKTSFHTILCYFDAYENLEVSDAIRKRKWSAAKTKRDNRFLELLKTVS